MSEIIFKAVPKENDGIEVSTIAVGEWSVTAVVAAFEGFGMALGGIVERVTKELNEEKQHEFVTSAALAINKQLMELTEKY